jgi:hypothetical protein
MSGAMADIDNGLDQTEDEGQRWIAENMQGLYQVRTARAALPCALTGRCWAALPRPAWAAAAGVPLRWRVLLSSALRPVLSPRGSAD